MRLYDSSVTNEVVDSGWDCFGNGTQHWNAVLGRVWRGHFPDCLEYKSDKNTGRPCNAVRSWDVEIYPGKTKWTFTPGNCRYMEEVRCK